MPSFSDETIEQWRAERVRCQRVPRGMSAEQVKMMRETIVDDMEEEGRRLQAARAQIRLSVANIDALRATSDRLRKMYGG